MSFDLRSGFANLLGSLPGSGDAAQRARFLVEMASDAYGDGRTGSAIEHLLTLAFELNREMERLRGEKEPCRVCGSRKGLIVHLRPSGDLAPQRDAEGPHFRCITCGKQIRPGYGFDLSSLAVLRNDGAVEVSTALSVVFCCWYCRDRKTARGPCDCRGHLIRPPSAAPRASMPV